MPPAASPGVAQRSPQLLRDLTKVNEIVFFDLHDDLCEISDMVDTSKTGLACQTDLGLKICSTTFLPQPIDIPRTMPISSIAAMSSPNSTAS